MSQALYKGSRTGFVRAGWITIFATAFLVACGGGGSEGPTARTAGTTAVAVSVASFSKPAIGVAPAPESAKKFALSATLSADSSDPYGGVPALEAAEQLFDKVAEAAYPQFFPPHQQSQGWLAWHYRYYPETGRYVGVPIYATPDAGLVLGGVYVMGGTFGDTPVYVGQLTQYIKPVQAWWAAARITPMGVKVFGANQLPPGCNAWAQQCWKDSVANGTVKFVASGMMNYLGRPIVFAYFRNTTTMFGVAGLWNDLAVNADDGTLVGSDIVGGSAEEITWIQGNHEGDVVHGSEVGKCYQTYNYVNPETGGTGLSVKPVTCPA